MEEFLVKEPDWNSHVWERFKDLVLNLYPDSFLYMDSVCIVATPESYDELSDFQKEFKKQLIEFYKNLN